MECIFLVDIIEIKYNCTLGIFLPLRPLRVNSFLQKYQEYVWYYDDFSLVDHRMLGPFHFGERKNKEIKLPKHDQREKLSGI